jgi:hypothetical protein
MAYARFVAALLGPFLLLLGTLTVVHLYPVSERDVYHFLAGSSHRVHIRQLASARSPDVSNAWSFVPRDHVSDDVINKRLVDVNNSVSTPAAAPNAWNGPSAYNQLGTSGVAAMQLSVIDDQFVILFDKAEHNPLMTSDGNNAWSALLDTHAHTVRALKLITNSYCAGELSLHRPRVSQLSTHFFLWTVDYFKGGGWLGNGTLIDYGGNSRTNIPSGNGVMGIRLYTPQPNGVGEIWEDPATIHLTTNR